MTERKLAAIMFTDLVGYVALSQRNEALALELLKEHQELLRPLFTQHHGTEIKTIGDAFLVEFASAVEAAMCAIDIQKMLVEHNASATPQRRILLRIGLHVGDVVYEEGDVLGDGVNIASRIEPLAEPGGICVSEDVAHQIENKINQPLELVGEKDLKGIKKPVTVYRIVLPWEQQAGFLRLAQVALRKPVRARWVQTGVIVLIVAAGVGWWWTSQRVPSIRPGQITRLAVLPFANLMNDPEQEYFVDGMHDALLTELSKLGALTVISRQSVMRYKGSDKSLGEIARELQAHVLVEGSVLRADGHVRINVQLIEAAADRHLWAEIFDRKLEDVLALHSNVARAIAREIQVTITPEEESRLADVRRVDPEAYRLYLLGMYHRSKWQPAELDKAIRYFQQAIALDPQFAQAYAGLAGVYGAFAFFGFMPPRQAYDKIKTLQAQALEIDSNLADAHRTYATTSFYFDWDWEKAEEEFQRTFELNPSDAQAHQFYTWFLVAMGRTEQAHTTIRRALELEPLGINAYLAASDVFFMSRQYDEAITQLREVLDISPNQPFALFRLGSSYVEQGMFNEAIGDIEQALTLSPGNTEIIMVLGHAYASAGNTAKARKILDDLHGLAKIRYVPPYAFALIHTGLGENEEALEWLERAYQDRNSWMPWMQVEPRLDPLREEPRFQDLLRRMNFPE